jgi:hypothetical protein
LRRNGPPLRRIDAGLQPAEIPDVGDANDRQRGDDDDRGSSNQRVGNADGSGNRTHDRNTDRNESKGAEHVVRAHA